MNMNLDRPTARQRLEQAATLFALGIVIALLTWLMGVLCGNLNICIG